MNDLECVWQINDIDLCGGEILRYKIFDDQLTISMCELHYKDHLNTMTLIKHGVNVDDLLFAGREAIQEAVDKLKVSV